MSINYFLLLISFIRRLIISPKDVSKEFLEPLIEQACRVNLQNEMNNIIRMPPNLLHSFLQNRHQQVIQNDQYLFLS